MKILESRLPSAIAIAALCYAASAAADLSLDTTFSGDGIATINLAPDLDSARDIAVQADGKYVVAGVSRQTTGANTFVYAVVGRFNTDGTPDTTFGTNGTGTVALLPGGTPNNGGGGDARAIAVQPADQKIVIAGDWNANDQSGGKVFLARLNTDGSLDPGFGNGGQTVIGLAGLVGASTSALALQADGLILVGGGANVFTKQAFILRILADASAFDLTFANAGLYTAANPGGVNIPFAFKAVTEIPAALGGGILAGGGPDDLVLTKLTSVGALDTNFGTGGIAAINVATTNAAETDDDIKAFALQSDGSILVAGSAEPAPYNGNLNVVLGRVTAAGALDTTYGTNGFVVFPDLSVDELATAVAIRPFGDSVAVGVGFNPIQVSPNGQVTSPLGTFNGGILASIEPLADGSLVGTGSRQVAGNDFEITAVRLNATDRSDNADQTPDPFTFLDQPSVPLASVITSNAVQIAGIDAPAPISVTGGEYALGCVNPFTTAVGTIQNGQTVCVRHTSAAVGNTTTNTTLTIGGVSDIFTSTTLNVDVVPEQFNFTAQTGVDLSILVTSNAVTIAGINSDAPISVTGGRYAIGCVGAFTTVTGRISNGQTVCVQHTSAAFGNTSVDTTLNIGGVTALFRSTTRTIDQTPNVFAFAPKTNVARNDFSISETVTITGIDAPTPISISKTGVVADGFYSVGCTGTLLENPSTISNGQTVCVVVKSADADNTPKSATLTIGGVSAVFTATTGDTVPDPFTFTDQVGVGLSEQLYSAPVAITGTTAPTSVKITGGGEYSIDCAGTFTRVAGVVDPPAAGATRTICVREFSSANKTETTSTTLTVGGISDTFTVTTTAGGPLPGASAMDGWSLAILAPLLWLRRRRAHERLQERL